MNQKLKSEETQNLILESAFALFHDNGYKATSIPDIVKRAGMSKGAFYHHFNDKKDVGEKTLAYILRNRIYKGMVAPLKGKLAKPVVPFLIDLFTDRIRGFSQEDYGKGCPLNNLINELGCSEEIFRISLKKIIEEWKTALINLLKQGQEKGEIRKEVDPESTAIYLISSFEGARGIEKLYGDGSLLEQYLKGVVVYIQQLK